MTRETKDNILMIILGVTFFLNIIAINLFPSIIEELVAVGYTIFGIGAVFYILSVFTLRRKGVSRIADSGIYGIVRHPMYLGAINVFRCHYNVLFSFFLGSKLGSYNWHYCSHCLLLPDYSIRRGTEYSEVWG